MDLSNFLIVIPCLNPDNKLIDTVKELKNAGFTRFVIINDGSQPEYNYFFEKTMEVIGSKGTLLKHSINLGQGRAYKTAFNHILANEKDIYGVLQCDSDGQHTANDVLKCAKLMEIYPNELILGVRDFKSKDVPFRSKFGNIITSCVFRFFCGLKIDDTQTGLKGIPISLLPFMMEAKGERYEYCSSVLLETKKRGYVIRQFSIETVYINDNETSHFNPIIDSIRIYSLLFRYIISSISAFIVDILFFSILLSITKAIGINNEIVLSTYLAKIVSCTYSFFVNKRIVFSNKDSIWRTSIRFIILCVLQTSISAFSVRYLCDFLKWNEVLIKVIVDTLLFFISFQAQQNWVFKNKNSVRNVENASENK